MERAEELSRVTNDIKVPAMERRSQDRRLLVIIGLSALVFRLALLLTDPIAELDIYRYEWDGEVCCHSVNPWYWTWAVPLLPFARGKEWFALSGLALGLAYLRTIASKSRGLAKIH